MEVPLYPPFVEGLPYDSVESLLRDQSKLIAEIKQASGLNPRDYESYILPAIKNYAGYAHHLPASQSNHHKHAGGLFHHGLDVALKAARRSDSALYMNIGCPTDKKKGELAWRCAAIVGGLIHDVGKSVSDMKITNKDGIEWNPHEETLVRWLEKNNYAKYWVTWRRGRHKKHMIAGNIPDNIIPEKTKVWMHSVDPELNGIIINTITSNNEDTDLSEIIHGADSDSVSEDLNKYGLLPDQGGLGIPLGRIIIDHMVQLIEEERWSVNKVGGRVWVTKEGVFVVWKPAAADITKKISKDRIKGIPKAADSIAKHLIDHKLAELNTAGDQNLIYWKVTPEILKKGEREISLQMLKMENPELLFPTGLPKTTKVRIGDEDSNKNKVNDLIKTADIKKTRIEKEAKAKGITIIKTPGSKEPKTAANKLSTIIPKKETSSNNIDWLDLTDENKVKTQTDIESNKPQENEKIIDAKKPKKGSTPTITSMFDGIAEDSANEQESNPFTKTSTKKPPVKNKSTHEPTIKVSQPPKEVLTQETTPSNKVKPEISSNQKRGADAPVGLKKELITFQKKAPNLFSVVDNKIHLKKSWKKTTFHMEPNELMQALSDKGYLYKDPRKSSMKSFMINNVSTLILNLKISEELISEMNIKTNTPKNKSTHKLAKNNKPKIIKKTIKAESKKGPKAPNKVKKTIIKEAKPNQPSLKKPLPEIKKKEDIKTNRIENDEPIGMTFDELKLSEECKTATKIIKLFFDDDQRENFEISYANNKIILKSRTGYLNKEISLLLAAKVREVQKHVMNCHILKYKNSDTLELSLK